MLLARSLRRRPAWAEAAARLLSAAAPDAAASAAADAPPPPPPPPPLAAAPQPLPPPPRPRPLRRRSPRPARRTVGVTADVSRIYAAAVKAFSAPGATPSSRRAACAAALGALEALTAEEEALHPISLVAAARAAAGLLDGPRRAAVGEEVRAAVAGLVCRLVAALLARAAAALAAPRPAAGLAAAGVAPSVLAGALAAAAAARLPLAADDLAVVAAALAAGAARAGPADVSAALRALGRLPGGPPPRELYALCVELAWPALERLSPFQLADVIEGLAFAGRGDGGGLARAALAALRPQLPAAAGGALRTAIIALAELGYDEAGWERTAERRRLGLGSGGRAAEENAGAGSGAEEEEEKEEEEEEEEEEEDVEFYAAAAAATARGGGGAWAGWAEGGAEGGAALAARVGAMRVERGAAAELAALADDVARRLRAAAAATPAGAPLLEAPPADEALTAAELAAELATRAAGAAAPLSERRVVRLAGAPLAEAVRDAASGQTRITAHYDRAALLELLRGGAERASPLGRLLADAGSEGGDADGEGGGAGAALAAAESAARGAARRGLGAATPAARAAAADAARARWRAAPAATIAELADRLALLAGVPGAATPTQVVQSARALGALRARHAPLLAAAAAEVAAALAAPPPCRLSAPALSGWLRACALLDWPPAPALARAAAAAVLATPAERACAVMEDEDSLEALTLMPWALAVLGLLDAPTLRAAAARCAALLAAPATPRRGDFGPQPLYQAALHLRAARGVPLEASLPDAALRAAGAAAWAARGGVLTTSAAQRSVAAALGALGLRPRLEHAPPGSGLCIDVAVWAPDGSGRRAAVEVDGPHHYVTDIGPSTKRLDENGEKLPPRRRPVGSTRLRDEALAEAGWPVVVVPTAEWAALRGPDAAPRLAYLRAKLVRVLGPL
jgi:hypothetical protein